MPGLGDTVAQLARMRRNGNTMLASLTANLSEPLRLTLVAPRGSNPGDLRMLTYVPPGLAPGAPLVTVLHGCTQNAAAYDHGSGWSTLAQRHGFALLFIEQQRGNNANLCFNWFQDEDTRPGRGEIESIRQMVAETLAALRCDPRRSFVTGLSAGGAMTLAALVTAPSLFAAGAVIAGLPYGAAHDVMDAFSTMSQPPALAPGLWAAKIRAANPGRDPAQPYPALQVWQGTADTTVSPANAAAIVAQWSALHGLPLVPPHSEQVDGARHDVWPASHANPLPVLEQYVVPGLGHGTPITPGEPDNDRAVGIASPHMLASTISSTWHIARGWGLLTQPARQRTDPPRPAPAAPSLSPTAIIDRAFKAAGLR